MAESLPQQPQPGPKAPRFPAWIVGIIVGTAFATILAVQLPDRVKLLGLFPVIWGGLIGLGYGWWAGECRIQLTRWSYVFAFFLLAAGEAGIVYQSWQNYRQELRQQFARDPAAGMTKQAEQTPVATDDPEQVQLRKQLVAELERVRQRRREALGLSTFLQRRLKKLGHVPQPWPELFYAGEILFGGLAGLAALRFNRPRESQLVEPDTISPT